MYSDGGKFGKEMSWPAKTRLMRLNQAGKAKLIPSKKLVVTERELLTQEKTRSNDLHILALAKVSGARLLFTEDKNLMEDFKNTQLINNPKGRIYSRASNKDLLTDSECRV